MKLGQIINVPIFPVPWAPLPNVAALTAFGGMRRDVQSISPKIAYRAFETAGFAPAQLASYVGNITGASVISLNPSGGGANLVGQASNQYLEPNYLGLSYYDGLGNAHLQLINQPRAPGSYGSAPVIERFVAATNLMPIVLANFREPVLFRQQPGFFYAGASPNGSAFAQLFNGASLVNYDAWRINTQLFPWVWGAIGKSSAQSVAPNGTHYFFLGANASHTKLLFPYALNLFTGTPVDVTPVMFEPIFENPTSDPKITALQTAFSADATYDVYPYFNGWLIILQTAGAGPTGQTCEIAVCDFGMQVYNLINLNPQDGTGVTARNRVGAPWQAWIDTNGIFYWNSGAAADVLALWYSYSAIPWAYPQIAYAPPPPILLPCYNPCNPLQGF